MSASNLLIRQAAVLIDGAFQASDVLVRNGKIAQVAPEIAIDSDTQ
ncbi:MAG: hypothetical protein F6K28_49295, partial [Microcoleus sp. SIO2G3]|nr:hypothetical protein [Microcoleus sp. SIO2G3]